MTDRERLTQLIGEIRAYTHANFAKVTDDGIANFLLENGIIVPPCKVGDQVYEIVRNKDPKLAQIWTTTCVGFHSSERENHNGRYQLSYIIVRGRYSRGVHHTDCKKIGRTVFFDLAEAEAVLQKIRGEEE